jgi:hypothetical protein
MSNLQLSATDNLKSALDSLFQKPPVLVELRFPGMAVSPDWYLCEDARTLESILQRLGPGVEAHFSSVWDLKNVKGETVLSR